MKYRIKCECRKINLGLGGIKTLPEYDLSGKISGYGLASYHTDGSICLTWDQGKFESFDKAIQAMKLYSFLKGN